MGVSFGVIRLSRLFYNCQAAYDLGGDTKYRKFAEELIQKIASKTGPGLILPKT